MKKSVLKIALISAAIAFAAGQSARAQWGMNAGLAMDMSVNAGYYILSDTVLEHAGGTSTSKKKKSRKKAAKPKVNPKAYEFRWSEDLSRSISRGFIDAMRDDARKRGALDEATAAQLDSMLQWGVPDLMRKSIRKEGYNPDSLATAMSFWLAINYRTIHNAEGKSTPPYRKLLEQMQVEMSRDPKMLAMSDSERQQTAEVMLWMAFMQIMVQEDAGNDPEKMRQAADTARSSLLEAGIDPANMTIGKQGLQMR